MGGRNREISMQFAIKCLVGFAVLLSPCAWDTDPRELATTKAALAQLAPTEAGQKVRGWEDSFPGWF
jgi:hypothetical protein